MTGPGEYPYWPKDLGPIETFDCRDCGETFDREDGTTSNESAGALLCGPCSKAEAEAEA